MRTYSHPRKRPSAKIISPSVKVKRDLPFKSENHLGLFLDFKLAVVVSFPPAIKPDSIHKTGFVPVLFGPEIDHVSGFHFQHQHLFPFSSSPVPPQAVDRKSTRLN